MPAQHAAMPSAPYAAEAEWPHLRGNMLERCNWLRWKVIPASPSSAAPGYKALKPLVLETPSNTKDRMFSMVPAAVPLAPSLAGGAGVQRDASKGGCKGSSWDSEGRNSWYLVQSAAGPCQRGSSDSSTGGKAVQHAALQHAVFVHDVTMRLLEASPERTQNGCELWANQVQDRADQHRAKVQGKHANCPQHCQAAVLLCAVLCQPLSPRSCRCTPGLSSSCQAEVRVHDLASAAAGVTQHMVQYCLHALDPAVTVSLHDTAKP